MQETSDYDGVDVEELRKSVVAGKVMALHIRAMTGELLHVWGCVIPGEAPVNEAGTWHWDGGCVYVQHGTEWKKVCNGVMVVHVQASDGKVVRVQGNTTVVARPEGSVKGSWFWETHSPGCVYVRHSGVWKKVCD